ncbi:MAG: hypothetical protein V1858_01820 [Candidatus Gottesmanbacteria bacterium]
MKLLKFIFLGIGIYLCLPWLDKFLIKVLHRSISFGSEYKTQEECVDHHGDWGRAGLFPQEICRIPASDFGKTCIAGFQCQTGSCVALYRFRNNPLIPGGKCPKYMSIFGCTQEVHFGIPKNAICRD